MTRAVNTKNKNKRKKNLVSLSMKDVVSGTRDLLGLAGSALIVYETGSRVYKNLYPTEKSPKYIAEKLAEQQLKHIRNHSLSLKYIEHNTREYKAIENIYNNSGTEDDVVKLCRETREKNSKLGIPSLICPEYKKIFNLIKELNGNK